jgi:hypothetical protein
LWSRPEKSPTNLGATHKLPKILGSLTESTQKTFVGAISIHLKSARIFMNDYQFLKLDEVLGSGRPHSMAQLENVLEAHKRTVHRRISELEEFANCEVKFDKHCDGYLYARPPQLPVVLCTALGPFVETREWIVHAQCAHQALCVRAKGKTFTELLPFLVVEVVGQAAAVCGEAHSNRCLVIRLKNIQVLAAEPYRGDWKAAKQLVSADYLRRLERDELEQCLAA